MFKYKMVIDAYVLAAMMLLTSCGQSADNKNNSKDRSPAENTETSIPGIEKLNFMDTNSLAGEPCRVK